MAEKQKTFKWFPVMLLISVFQLMCASFVVFDSGKLNFTLSAIFLGYLLVEWIYMTFARAAFNLKHMELEALGFFLSGIGLTVSASVS